MTEQATGQTPIAKVKEEFAKNGFVFTSGELRDKPRYFGTKAGCTLELVGADRVEQATIVAQMAPDAPEIARLNGRRMAALMALLVGNGGVEWLGAVLRQMMVVGNDVKAETVLGAWQVRLIARRSKSVAVLKVRGR
jgi:hypothetical protein